MFFIDKELVF